MARIVNLSDVFISYSRRNTDFARQVDAALKAEGMQVWADWEDIPKGAQWRAEVAAGVEGANAFLFIISPDSVHSVECRKEIELALENSKRLVPILHQELAPEDFKAMHPAVGAHNWIFARAVDDWEKCLRDIVYTIRTDLDHVHTHTRLTVRAKEWDSTERNPSMFLTGTEITDAETWMASSAEKDPPPTASTCGLYLAESQCGYETTAPTAIGCDCSTGHHGDFNDCGCAARYRSQ